MKKKIFRYFIRGGYFYTDLEPAFNHDVIDIPFIVWQDYLAVCQRKEQIEKQIDGYAK